LIELGKINTLNVVRETANGVYLAGENLGEILMPGKFITDEVKADKRATVFIYADSEDRLVATTEKPFVKAGEFAFLKVVETNRIGAFLDWGLPKNLLVPFSEQKMKMKEDKYYLVYVYVDEKTMRLVASAKVEKFLEDSLPDYSPGEEVDLLIVDETVNGFKALVNNRYWGMIYKNQLFKPLSPGDKRKGYVQKIREDKKIDLLAEKPGYEKIDSISEVLLRALEINHGFLALSDQSSPEIIQSILGISKKSFKKAVGSLYKRRLIEFQSDGIKLVRKNS
jgi:uncharacterized protein